jgi:hypothetical protein
VSAAHIRPARALMCRAAVADSQHFCTSVFSVCRHV